MKLKNSISIFFIIFYSFSIFASDKKLSQQELEIFRRALKSNQAKVDQLKIEIPQLQKDINGYLNRAMELEKARAEFLRGHSNLFYLPASKKTELSRLNTLRREAYEKINQLQGRLQGLQADLVQSDGRLLAARTYVESSDLLIRDAVAEGIRQSQGQLTQARVQKDKADEVVISLNSHFDSEDMSLCLEQRLRSKIKDSNFFGRVSYKCSQQLAHDPARGVSAQRRHGGSSNSGGTSSKPVVK